MVWWTSFSTQYKSCLSERTERASYNDWGSSDEGLEGGAIALFPYQRSLKVKCLLNSGNTVWLWTLRLLHWPVKTPQWRRSHYPDKASELIELEGPSDPVMRSPHNPPTLCLTFACFSFFFLSHSTCVTTSHPESSSTPSRPSADLPHHSQDLSFWWTSHVSLKFLSQKSEEHWLKCLGKMNLGNTQQK